MKASRAWSISSEELCVVHLGTTLVYIRSTNNTQHPQLHSTPPLLRTIPPHTLSLNNKNTPHPSPKSQPQIYFFPFPFLTTTLKFPFPPAAASSLGASSFAGPFFATSLQPPGAALAGLPLLGGVEVSTRPLSARRLRRMNSSAKWRESMVEELP
jgi:hypothetical protein